MLVYFVVVYCISFFGYKKGTGITYRQLASTVGSGPQHLEQFAAAICDKTSFDIAQSCPFTTTKTQVQ